jgi:hypothetical protein
MAAFGDPGEAWIGAQDEPDGLGIDVRCPQRRQTLSR